MAIDLSQVRVSGPLSAFAIGFADNLVQQGYRPRVTCNHMRLLAHLRQWLGSEGLGASDLHVTALRSLLGFLHVDGVIAQSLAAAVPSVACRRLAGLPKGL